MLRAGVAEVVEGPALRPRADIDAGVLPDGTGRLQVLPPCPAGRAVRVRGAAECPGPPHGGDDRQDDREVAREEHDPFPRPPDRRRPRDGAEAPPPDEEVERRVERPDAEGQEDGNRTEEGRRCPPPAGRRTPGAEPPTEDRA